MCYLLRSVYLEVFLWLWVIVCVVENINVNGVCGNTLYLYDNIITQDFETNLCERIRAKCVSLIILRRVQRTLFDSSLRLNEQ